MTGHTPDETGLRLVWPSGVGGAQCEDCGETTIVRGIISWDDEEQLLCRECTEGMYDSNDDCWPEDFR